MTPTKVYEWHALDILDALEAQNSQAEGLNEDTARDRLAEYGPNSLPETRSTHPLLRFLEQFNNPLIYFLLAASVVTFLLDHAIDAAVILLVVLVNAVVGFVQEGRAETALQGMSSLISQHAIVLRDGEKRDIDVADLVPGDVVLIEAGDRVPADLRILRARGLAIEEAALTGESLAAEKQQEPASIAAPLGDRSSMAFSGMLVVRGQATGLVVNTGISTEIGKISGMLQQVPPLVTPLLQQINSFARLLTFVILGFGAALFAFAVLIRGFDPTEALIAVVAVAVGAIPEGLPAVITITLAIGVQRMASRRAVIRKLPAVESLGATSVICSDKTGTLTRNEMKVVRLITAEGEFGASGVGYAPEGTVMPMRGTLAGIDVPDALIRCGALCNDARLTQQDGQWSVAGDPMEGALLALAAKAETDTERLRGEWPRLDQIPFDASYRYMATLHRGPDEEHVVYIKGAPEAVLALCEETAQEIEWSGRVERAAAQGERLLGFAMLRLERPRERITHADLKNARMLGLMGFVDPPREEAKRAIAECRSAGIAIKMITGDHAATAVAIAGQLNLADNPQALTGTEIEALDDDELARRVEQVSVFARASPEHKLRIVRALQSHGHIVAMTGDGVNDAPSLKQADVGTAMGVAGTEAAREASEMVLLDDNFASIVAAVREGRTVYDNIRKVIAWTLPTSGGEAVVIVLAILAGFALPMTATQILWINLVTTVTLGLVLAFEPPEPGVMERPPRRRDTPLLTPLLVWRVALVSALFAAVSLLIFFGAQSQGASVEKARTMVVNMLVVAEIAYLFNVRFLHMRSLTLRGALGTRPVLVALAIVIVAQIAFTYLPFLQLVFETESLTIGEGAIIIVIGFILLLLLEAEKRITRRYAM
ncbi:HAD ATPase, P-type, family IC [Aurantiacibacter atlanticus]|uniref:HAD ATPase, P-type, family IC n=1 Tax=Aurantiacibacter atlanticus TaxID=1648404 RepID=A0A0H4VAX6_9SPHN|nr:HAD-IC family P-type ATPase [Aurantiacibacter atlanticus]AKQ41600.1 HAD ATPase, P-type, family IC [Aurantiacibacter atlanticus]